jgi:two-component system chemotaxis response regulator CheY
VRLALEAGEPYNLICLDIMMPEMDGKAALKAIRDLEETAGLTYGAGAKVIMTTALNDPRNVFASFNALCDAYLVKPISKSKLLDLIRSFGLVV